jgi:signal transduction histidine kinase/CheY-like chemotaxis protein
MYTGGFMSPFVIVYMLSMLLSIIMVDLVPVRVGLINFSIITGSYIFVSLAQKTGLMQVHVDYVERLMRQDYFFWLVFISVSICFVHGFIAVYASSRNIRDTLTQMILTYRHVAEGTSAFIGEHFENEICEALWRALQVTNAFLIELDNEDTHRALVFTVGVNGREQYEKEIGDEFRNFISESTHSEHLYKIDEIAVFPVTIVPASQFVYWIQVHDSAGTLCAILGITDPLANKTKGVLVADILQIFANRIAAELARSNEEKKRLQMQRLLGQGQKMQAIGKLANVVAHDFNNILNGIFGFASLINKAAGPDSVQAKYTRKIFQLGNNATTLISQLLSYSRTKQVNSASFDISAIVEECLEIIQLTVKKKISIINDNSESLFVNGDVSMVQSALLNLMINACDSIVDQGTLAVKIEKRYMGESEEQDFLSGQLIPPGEYTLVSVRDTGCGIPEDQLIRIFEPFFTTKGIGRGTGLGLAAVVGCMEAHNGYITIHSVLGNGSTFTLFFPLYSCQQEPAKETVKVSLDSSLTCVTSSEVKPLKDDYEQVYENKNQNDSAIIQFPDSQKILLRNSFKKIFVVDDEVMFLDAISTYLLGLKYDVISSSSGQSAEEIFKLKKGEIDIVILDMMIPDIPGRVLMDRFRLIKPEIDVIIMTGYSNLADLEYVKDRGIVTILNKPFEFNSIDSILLDVALKKV